MGIRTLSDTFNTFSIGRFNIYFSQRKIARHDLHENFSNRIDKNPKKKREIFLVAMMIALKIRTRVRTCVRANGVQWMLPNNCIRTPAKYISKSTNAPPFLKCSFGMSAENQGTCIVDRCKRFSHEISFRCTKQIFT